jgi:putative membrane protein
MKLRVVLIALLGLALAIYLIGYIGFGAVFTAALTAGWGGFAIVCGYALALYLMLGAAWHVLIAEAAVTRFAVFIWGRMVRDSAAEVLPFSQLGGFVIGARATILHGVKAADAFASTIVDVTTEMLAQLAYVALGIALLTARAPQTPFTATLTGTLIVGLVLASIVGVVFIFVQRRGEWVTEKLATYWLPERLAHASALAASLNTIYKSPLRVGLSFLLHVAGWIASAVGTWIAFRLIGAQVDLEAVIAIESLVYAIRSAAFVVPNALGVQEAAYALLAPLLGVGPELGLAVSLLKRARDIAIGIPVLLAWQTLEGKRALVSDRLNGELFKN